MLFASAHDVDEDNIEVHYNKNVELFYQNLVDMALECGWYVNKSEIHHLIFEMAIAGLKGHLLCVSLPNRYLMVGIRKIELGEISSPTKSV